MKYKSSISSCLVLFLVFQLFQSGLGVLIAQAQSVSATTQSIPLVSGWNLVSFNLHPTSTAVADVLATISGQYTLVYAYDPTNGWMLYDPLIGELSDLKTLDQGMGFWIKMNAARTLIVSGNPVSPTDIALKIGWNLVGYPSSGSIILPDALSLHGVGTDFSLVYAYHAVDTGDAWKLFDRGQDPLLNNLTAMAPGWGYWVKASANHTWHVEYSASQSPLYRFGVALARRPFTDYDSYDIASMRFGWYVDYTVNANAPTSYGMEYVPTVRIKQLKLAADGITKVACRYGPYYVSPPEYTVSPSISQIQSMATSRPGMTWLIGNEIERIDWIADSTCTGQDEIMPELYAKAYHDIYSAIKTVDPTAKVANGSLVEFTPLREKYLNRIWAEYLRLYNTTMPVDVWNMHFFPLQEIKGSWGAEIPAGLTETSGEQFTFPDDNWDFTIIWSQVISLRTWMKDHGQKDKPLFITEYGALYPYSYFSCYDSPDKTTCPLEVRDRMMYPSFNAFLNQTDVSLGDSLDGNHLVQRWIWWSADFDDGICDTGVFFELYGGALFNSGLGPSTPPANCIFPSQGITTLGTYWKQYVQNLP